MVDVDVDNNDPGLGAHHFVGNRFRMRNPNRSRHFRGGVISGLGNPEAE
jgi:hypothetical protein